MTHNTREWVTEFDEQFKRAIQLKNKPDGVTVTRLKHFIHQELQKAQREILHKLYLCASGKYQGDALENVKAQIKEYQSELDQPIS